MQLKIEKGVPLPQMRAGGGKYPFTDMLPGDSFFVPNESKAGKVSSAAYCWAKSRKVDAKFSARKVYSPDGVRCWRVS